MRNGGELFELLFLGTGTSTGVPMIGCDCPVCRSTDPRNRRRRSSLYVRAGDLYILIDTPPDFREQALEFRLPRVDAVLFTHAHADHVFGLDDLRRYNTIQNARIPAYGTPETIRAVRKAFGYIEADIPSGLYRPRIDFREVATGFRIAEVRVEPCFVEHGRECTVGFRLDWQGGAVGYVPDCRHMETAVVEKFRGVDVMILDALRHRPHKTHHTIEQSLEVLERIGAARSYMTHLSHDIDHAPEQARLPSGVYLAWDGLRVRVPVRQGARDAGRFVPASTARAET